METKPRDGGARSQNSTRNPPSPPTRNAPVVEKGEHLATFPHEGRFWDAFLIVADDPAEDGRCRARLRFLPSDDAGGAEPHDTAILIIERDRESVLEVARRYQRYEFSAFLRSIV